MRAISELPSLKGGKPQLRLGSSANNLVDGDEPAVTDNGLYIIDVVFDSPIAGALTLPSLMQCPPCHLPRTASPSSLRAETADPHLLMLADPPKAAQELKNTCGVFEHGLFCGMTTQVIIAGAEGITTME